MDNMLLIYAVIMTLLFFIFLILYVLHKHQIYTLNKKLKFINNCSTNMILTADFPSKDIYEMVNAINDLLGKYQKNIRDTEKKNTAVKETITNLAHDLRTPLTAIYGYAQMLQKSEQLNEKERENVEIIIERVDALYLLLNQLFEFARLESGEYTLTNTRIDLNAVLRKTIVSFYQQFEEKNVIPDIKIPDKVFSIYADEQVVTRIFNNIIYNALIHGTDEYAFYSTMKDETYEFCFKNRAEDISKEDVEQIFERFYTTDKSRSKKTTGLGLSIAKKLVTEMGGTIEASLSGNMFLIRIQFPKNKGYLGDKELLKNSV